MSRSPVKLNAWAANLIQRAALATKATLKYVYGRGNSTETVAMNFFDHRHDRPH